MSDGRVVIANGYNKGPVFIEATFPAGETLATCIPNQYLEPEGRFILRPPSALPRKGLAKQPEPKPKAQTKNKATPDVKATLKAKPTRQRKACTDQGKTQKAGPSGTCREQVTLPEGDAYTSNRSSDQRLGFCQIVHEKSCWQDGFHWCSLENRNYFNVCPVDAVPPLPLRVSRQRGVQISWSGDPSSAWAAAKTQALWDLGVLSMPRTTLHPQREGYRL